MGRHRTMTLTDSADAMTVPEKFFGCADPDAETKNI